MIQLPTYEEAYERFQSGEANPIDIFIVNNEPAGFSETEKFRYELANLISFVEIGTELCHINDLVPNCGYEKTCAFSKL